MDENVFSLHQGGKTDDEKKLSVNDYALTDIVGETYYASGFLIFTTQHVAVMEEQDEGAVPVLVLPLARLAAAEMIDPDEVFEADQA